MYSYHETTSLAHTGPQQLPQKQPQQQKQLSTMPQRTFNSLEKKSWQVQQVGHGEHDRMSNSTLTGGNE